MPLLDLFFAMLWFFLFFIWIWLLISVFGDMFRSDMSGWAKAGWAVLVIVLPIVGVLAYLIVHGGKMHERSMQRAAAVEQAQQDYVRSIAGTPPSTADELAKLADLHNRGVLTDTEYNSQKAALLGERSAPTMPEQRHPQAS